ncbi:BgtA-20356 [Blumeria graminis f. sp. tritici]|uniref:Branched-chain-amino-acid aminotransferase n=2 Tax=Blumeria graminis f. sp. tritici TaxID=62690 RepID=A0A9X9MQJ2_BLUGR|nr:hypothetical protein BGT96224_A20356 [Blumeria graminis f. sp. tritici 96224]VDB95201.1 BgtA-20356 [Blumeria graminis f. sp. tritici]
MKPYHTMLRQLRTQSARPKQSFLKVAFTTQPTRCYSFSAESALHPTIPKIDVSKLTVEKNTNPIPLPPHNELVFGHVFTDHMLSIEWNEETGWLSPRITPYQKLQIDPAACVLHYASECFEGMKAYRDSSNRIRLFRPTMNMARMNRSTARIALPAFESAQMIELISKLVMLEAHKIPDAKGYSLYLRPTMIGTHKTLGVGKPKSALFYVIACPVGPYYPTGFKAISLEATSYAVRAWPGGAGNRKLGANYAPCIVPQMEAAKRGFHQNLWLFGEDEYITEAGTMNLFVVLKDKKTGQKEICTAPLDGTILEGITRDSILSLAHEKLAPNGWKVSERKVAMRELHEASKEGRLLEVFGSGTAAVVCPVRTIGWREHIVDCGLKQDQEAGEVASNMLKWINSRQYGEEEHEWSYIIPGQ